MQRWLNENRIAWQLLQTGKKKRLPAQPKSSKLFFFFLTQPISFTCLQCFTSIRPNLWYLRQIKNSSTLEQSHVAVQETPTASNLLMDTSKHGKAMYGL